MKVVWNSSLETGIRSIDLQHEELIGMLNELQAAYANSNSQTVLEDVIQRLGAYVAFHFSTEEVLLASLLQSEGHVEQHLQQHRDFIQYLTAIREQSTLPVALAQLGELVAYLGDWLSNHILKTDRRLGILLNEQAARRHELENRR